ncbi:MAG: penicillin-binding transpeptidase domain-containing protein [Terriglobia bacterium]
MASRAQDRFHLRIFVLSGFFLVWILLLVFRLIDLQVFQYSVLCSRAKRQQNRSLEISAKRGTIYDRNGHELAVSVAVDSIYAVTQDIPDKEKNVVAARLSSVLGMNRQDLFNKLNVDRGFVWIKRKLDDSESARVKKLGLPGIYFEKETKRFYPNRELAAHVVGYAGMDNEGLGGIEFAYDGKIGGVPGRVLLKTDAKQRSFASVEKAPIPGEDLYLTLDQTIQYIAEQELAAQVTKSNALGGTAIVMDPYSGEILAMASYPTFNPNFYAKYPHDCWKNRSIASIYEPGSTFKIITASAALEENLAQPDETINCMNGSIVVGKYRIRDHKSYGVLSVREIVAYSSNIGAVQLGFRIGKERFERYIRSFGFGANTDVELPGEARGLLHPSSEWPVVTLANISMGQGIGVTPLQLVSAVSAIANGGFHVKPKIILKPKSNEIEKVSYDTGSPQTRLLSSRTTKLIKEMLTGVVTKGTGKASQLEGFTAAGKTGTAQKLDPNGRYSHTRFIASFVGFAPIDRPAVVIVVTVDEPHGQYYGGEVAAPVFRNIAQKTLRYFSVLPDQDLKSSPKNKGAEGKLALTAMPNLNDDQFEPLEAVAEFEASANTQSAEPPTPDLLTEAQDKLLDDSAVSGAGVVLVPDLRGRSLRSATTEATRLGLNLSPHGSGFVIEQSPEPTKRVSPGTRIVVRLERNR